MLRHKTFAECSDAELAELQELMREGFWLSASRRTRRHVTHRRGELDVREMVRAELNSAGAPPTLRWRRRRTTERALVLMLDVSGSMSEYSRPMLMFAHSALAEHRNLEVFCFGTRLSHVTSVLRGGTVDDALKSVAGEVRDWHGGTRIGESLKAVLDGWGQTRSVRGCIAVICSDGLEVGEAETLRTQMIRLHCLARDVVWLNPLKRLEAYEPLAKGMQAALPQIDVFSSGDNLASLDAVARRLAEVSGGRNGRRRAAPARHLAVAR